MVGIKNLFYVLRDKIAFGRFYIIAPENASSGEVDINEWTDIWQYGSNEELYKNEKWKLDGIAPQTPIIGIQGNRAYIPENIKQDFYLSHTISNYFWIFTQKEKQDGFVKPRN